MANICVVAPAGKFNPEGLNQGLKLLQSWGHTTIKAPNLYAQAPLTAGSAQDRAEDLIWALHNSAVDVICYARGGYGSCELLELMDLENLPVKPIIGFSDATALGTALNNMGYTNFFHAPVLHSLTTHPDPPSIAALKEFLETSSLPTFQGEWLYSSSSLQGPLAGGNLCMLTTLMGTPWEPKLNGCILMLEEIGEPAYKIQRMLSQLRYSGILKNVKAIAFGSFTNCPFPQTLTLKQLLEEFAQKIKVPVIYNLPFGHGKANLLWQMGRTYKLTSNGTFAPTAARHNVHS